MYYVKSYVGWGCILNCFMLSFPTLFLYFCCSDLHLATFFTVTFSTLVIYCVHVSLHIIIESTKIYTSFLPPFLGLRMKLFWSIFHSNSYFMLKSKSAIRQPGAIITATLLIIFYDTMFEIDTYRHHQ